MVKRSPWKAPSEATAAKAQEERNTATTTAAVVGLSASSLLPQDGANEVLTPATEPNTWNDDSFEAFLKQSRLDQSSASAIWKLAQTDPAEATRIVEEHRQVACLSSTATFSD